MLRRVAIAAGLVLLELLALHGLASTDHRVQDWILRQHARSRAPDAGIVLVNIDERSLSAMNADFGAYPWPRSVYAEFIEKLAAQQPAAIVFDQVFADPVREHADEDAYFTQAFAAAPYAYAAMVWLEGVPEGQGLSLRDYGAPLGIARTAAADPAARLPLLLPFERIARSGRVGLINFLADDDGVGRRYWLFKDQRGWRVPSLPARVAQGLRWPLPPGETLEINWRGAAGQRPQVSFADVFQDLERSRPLRPPDEFRGKVLIVGATAAGLNDLRPTALSGALAGQPGPEILAAALETIKHSDPLRRLPCWGALLFGLLPLALLGLGYLRGVGLLWLGVGLLTFSPAAVAAAWAAPSWRWLLPVSAPLAGVWTAYLGLALSEYVRERRQRAHAVQVFSRFVHPQVVRELVASQLDLLERPAQSREITLLFSDIRGFTTYSETRPPEQVVKMLNRYFSLQVAVVFKHGGTVDKFIGDAIMAFWGAPLADPRHAEHAVRAALEMQDVVLEFARELAAEGVVFDIGIGLHTGTAVVGFIGAQNKTDYTAIGDTVNLASRIEGLTKGVARILVSEQTRAEVGDTIAFADRGEFKAKGREQPVRLFEPLA
jgi:adenylate cyclase